LSISKQRGRAYHTEVSAYGLQNPASGSASWLGMHILAKFNLLVTLFTMMVATISIIIINYYYFLNKFIIIIIIIICFNTYPFQKIHEY